MWRHDRCSMRVAMTYKLLIPLCLGAALASIQLAHADVVSDRVVLVTGASGCPAGSRSFRRLEIQPDGRSTLATTEYVVPAGKYLEITSVEYTMPYFTRWAGGWQQSIDIALKPRAGGPGTNLFHIPYINASMYDQDEDGELHGFGQYVGTGGPLTHALSFPVGPLMGSTGRLCASAHKQFWLFYGAVRIFGRLISTGEIIVGPPGGGVLTPN